MNEVNDNNVKDKNLVIWNQAKETDPRFTKRVSFGARSFTSIDAHYQIRRATEIFGPVGASWGYDVKYDTLTMDNKAFQFADVSIWVGKPEYKYGPVRGCNLLVDAKGRVTAASNGSSGGITGSGTQNFLAK